MSAIDLTAEERAIWCAAFGAAIVMIPGDNAHAARSKADEAVRALRRVRADRGDHIGRRVEL